MVFKIYDCDFGIKVADVNYDFEHCDSFVIEDPESLKLIRGANAKNKLGLLYTEGSKEAKKITVTLVGITTDMFNLLGGVYKERERVEVYCVDRKSGSNIVAKNAILSQKPRQNNIEESPESMNVTISFETYDLNDSYKDVA